MIGFRLARISVFRRPAQNIAVIMGITLGVSLFVGVQVGTDSLETGFNQFAQHFLGEMDAEINSPVFPFFINQAIIEEELGIIDEAPRILDIMSPVGIHSQYIKGMAERLSLSSTVIQEDLGTIEISKPVVGIDPNEKEFGDLINQQGEKLFVNQLALGEIFIGEETANLLFQNDDPIGKNITISTTIFTAPTDPSNFSSSIPLNLEKSMKIIDVFVDAGKGRERFADYIATNLQSLQKLVETRINLAKTTNPEIIGYGAKPINRFIVNWNDDIKIGSQSKIATEALQNVFEERMGVFENIPIAVFYSVQDTRRLISEFTEQSVGGIGTILNIFGSIIILAGILVIINIQSMALASREKETGILRAVGSKKSQIINANLFEAMLLGIIGSLLGLLGGALYGKLLVFSMGVAFEFPTSDIPTVITQRTLIISFIAGFIISQITGIFPAIQASRINVAQVLRGLAPPSEDKFGKKTLYLGIVITAFAILSFLSIDPNPLIEGQDAFRSIDNTEKIYLPVIYLILGPSLLFSYFKSKKIGLTVVSIFTLLWANFNIFVIFDWIREGNGGLNYILYIILSLISGSIILFGMNLNYIANFGQRFSKLFLRKKGSSMRGTVLVAFRKMTSKPVRSTLTFALFATILTLNIFIATWSTSFRFGFDEVVDQLSGGTDVVFQAESPINDSIGFDQLLIDQYADSNVKVQFMRTVTMTASSQGYLNNDIQNKENKELDIRLVTMDKNSLWDDDKWIIKLNLADNKGETEFETYQSSSDDPPQTAEDEFVWKQLLANGTTVNHNNEIKPMIVTTVIGEFTPSRFIETHKPGDSVFLNLTDGSLQEFVIASTAGNNPLVDMTVPSDGPPVPASVWFVSDYWKNKLLAFNGLVGHSNVFIGKTNVKDITSSKIEDFITDVEVWANQKDGEFRQTYGLLSIIGSTVYSIYEIQLESSYRFFLFLQAFVSFGFVVGILGLLVVASRSVAERKREIGMLRALGFKRSDVIVSVVLELIVMALIGLVIGFINGTILGYALTNINSGGDAKFLIPWGLMAFYGALTVGSAILAAIVPAYRASRIPPSEALRYTG